VELEIAHAIAQEKSRRKEKGKTSREKLLGVLGSSQPARQDGRTQSTETEMTVEISRPISWLHDQKTEKKRKENGHHSNRQ
jgi:hypothetical protein